MKKEIGRISREITGVYVFRDWVVWFTVFGVSKANILERDNTNGMFADEGDETVSISKNLRIENMIEEGVDGVDIYKESSGRFQVIYGGYLSGSFLITDAGVEELKEYFLDDQDEIPYWVLSTDIEKLPDWFPRPGTRPDPVICEKCGRDVAVTEVITPIGSDGLDYFCPECWETS